MTKEDSIKIHGLMDYIRTLNFLIDSENIDNVEKFNCIKSIQAARAKIEEILFN